jgi:hypothetical protein
VKIRKGEQIPVEKDGKPVKRGGDIVMRPVERPWFVFSTDMQKARYIPNPQLTKKENEQKQMEAQDREYRIAHDLLDTIYNHYGTNQIMELIVHLPYPNAHHAFNFWLEAYVANQKIAQSDERTITYLFDTLTGEVLIRNGLLVRYSSNPHSVDESIVKSYPLGGTVPYEKDMVIGETKTKNEPVILKPVGRLNVFMPELRRGGTALLNTGSWRDITSIYSAVELINQISQVTGRPANTIPLRLTRVPTEFSYEDENGKTRKSTKYFIEAEVISDGLQGMLTALESPMTYALTSGVKDEPMKPEPEEDYGDYPDEITEAEIMSDDEPPEAPPLILSDNVPPVKMSDVGKRPYPPEVLFEKIKNMCYFHQTDGGTKVAKNAGQVLAKHLNSIFGNATDRYVFTAWILGEKEGSAKSIKGYQIAALLDWLGVKDFKDQPNQHAVAEAKATLEYINLMNGQKFLSE